MIDLVGYRRYGHNEIDEPDFTQPHTYEKVKAQKTCPLLYSESLVKKGIIREDFYE
jgi:2-oxoglutarate dehydrogenase complex dehydrogenase (E1) component-like enzyme